jgi:hypothetical protein
MQKLRKTPLNITLKISFLLIGIFFAYSLTSNPVQAQESKSRQNTAQGRSELFPSELNPESVDPEFIRRYSSPARSEGIQKQVRVVYIVPSDKAISDDYKAAITDAILHLQDFYQRQMGGGLAFSLHNPIVEVHQSSHTTSWFSTNPSSPNSAGWFWENSLAQAFLLTGGGFNDPNYRWVYYVDADPACNQYVGGTQGVALLPANDLRGLTRQQNIPPCVGQQPDNAGVYRWIGGLGHELGHTFDLPHPPGCDQGACQGGNFAFVSLMYVGYASYPNTYLLSENITQLMGTGFFSVLNLNPPKRFDVDRDNKADVGVWRPGTGTWYFLQSSTGNAFAATWGLNGDRLVPGDYDGDGKADVAIWRPSNGTWSILRSSDNTLQSQAFGISSDLPVPGDYDGDNKTDVAVWRPSSGTWYAVRSATNTLLARQWGSDGDLPVPGDYNGDKRTDVAVWRPGNRTWYVFDSYTGNFTARQFGNLGDRLVQADYDGDGKTDIAVWRPGSGTWYISKSSNGALLSQQFGVNGDVPAPGDYDGDGQTDVAVWRESNTYFYILRSSDSTLQAVLWGSGGDVPVASAFVQ